MTTDYCFIDKPKGGWLRADNGCHSYSCFICLLALICRGQIWKKICNKIRLLIRDRFACLIFVGLSILTHSLCLNSTGANSLLSGLQVVPPAVCLFIGNANILIPNFPGSANCRKLVGPVLNIWISYSVSVIHLGNDRGGRSYYWLNDLFRTQMQIYNCLWGWNSEPLVSS